MKHSQSDNKALSTHILAGLFLFLTVFLFSCDEPDSVPTEDETELPTLAVLFEANYINFAWGYQHNGWFLDNHGKLKKYSISSSLEWKSPDNQGYISKEDLTANYALATTPFVEVARSIVRQKETLIEGSINGQLSDPVNRGADIGGFGWYCYVWDADKEMYKRQILGASGDWEQFNLEPDAQALLKWLQTFQVD